MIWDAMILMWRRRHPRRTHKAIITSSLCETTSQRRFDVIITLSSRRVSVGHDGMVCMGAPMLRWWVRIMATSNKRQQAKFPAISFLVALNLSFETSLHFPSFLNIEMAHVIELIRCGSTMPYRIPNLHLDPFIHCPKDSFIVSSLNSIWAHIWYNELWPKT